ncbi:peptidase M14 carboxypeptidase A [Natronococcus amylolyticus DSM 10524]|uniref:Peptidase M14 carboxypeptidase A n=1 Tax=Natronococcus amylolyticus DSM 10524 TaxID=1227497 RepID=L9X856_9EURY|nr:M14 family metallopeptidase [Natronococcus amylolyticus]ELY56818.1 peptidase M14 carboxypeptidase A [Natronococcus amylolyticus DSM 10524]
MSKHDPSTDRGSETDDQHDHRGHGHGHEVPDAGAFDGVSIDRRQFGKLAAAVGAALTLPGNAVADLVDSAMTDEYEYVVNHTPDDYAVATLIRLEDESAIDDLLGLGLDLEAATNDDLVLESPPAVYAQLTTAQVEEALDLPSTEELSYTPGSNPFWRLGEYPLGVFPAPYRSVDFIHYEQMIDGMDHLEAEHADTLNFYALADADNPHDVTYDQSPGHTNNFTDRHDPKDLHVAELTKPPEGYDTVAEFRESDEFADRQKVVFEASIHGLERAGPEACYRFIERIVTGRETEYERLLEECVLIILSVNPDGWVARDPQYDSGWQVAGEGRDDTRLPAWPQYERGNSQVFDTNRQYPSIGWIDPAHHPGEPDESRWAEDNPHDIINTVPDAMGAVEHFRQYDNLTHGADLHAMLWNSDFILGLINQIEYTQDEFHDLYEMNQVLEESLEEKLDEWEGLADAQEAATDDFNTDAMGFPVLPETAYDYSTIWDTIGYTITGGLIGFMGASEERGGLDMTTMAFEMAYSHMVGGNKYEPALAEMWVEGYMESMRTMTEYALRDVDSEVATADGEGETVAYVTSDTLTRSSEDLEFLQDDPDNEETTTDLSSEQYEAEVDPEETGTVAFDVAEGLHTLSVHAHAEQDLADVVLFDPDGEEVRAYRPSETGGEAHHDFEPFVIREPDAGEWSLEITSLMAENPVAMDVNVGTLQSEYDHPDPRDALGFEQEAYEVTPLAFFEDFDTDNELVATEALTPEEVAEAGVDADHLVIVHDDRGDDPEGYVANVDEFVDAGGNLVVTDTGLHLLADMETASEIGDDDVTDETFGVSHLEDKDEDHPLLTDTRPIQRMTWKVAPLGYPYADDAPMTLLDADAFEASGGAVAGTTDDLVSAGSIFTDDEEWQGIHAIGGLLPPASQEELHPFGLKNYVLAYFGLTAFVNALGMEQRRFVDGDLERTIGDADQDPAPVAQPEPEFEATGERDDSGSVFTGGQTNRTELDVEVLEPEDEPVLVRDTVPENWDVDEDHGDVEATTPATDGGTHVYFGVDDPQDAYEELTHFAEAPDDVLDSDVYEFGPIAVSRDTDDDATLTDREWIDLEGTDREVTVVAEDT